MSLDLRNLGERVEAVEAMDQLVGPLAAALTRVLPRGPAKDALHGVWLGHPLHPLLTDLPIGFWTSALVLDLVGGRRARPAAGALIGVGVVSALPTAAAGLADWSELNQPERRSGLIHAAAGVAATALYGLSFRARLRDRHARGVILGLAGAMAASVGGFLGGHLAFRRAAAVNHAIDAPADSDWADVLVARALSSDGMTLARLGDAPLAAVGGDTEPAALFARCSHLGGPLDQGDLVDGCVRCPWHASTFRLHDGTVVSGPATAAQPAYELRVDGDRVQGRRRLPR